MAIQADFERLSVKSKYNTLTGQQTVEVKAPIEDDVKKIFSTACSVFPMGSEVTEGQIKYTGRAIFRVVYLDIDGNLKKAEAGAEFSNKIESDKIENAQKALVDFKVVKADTEESNGGYIFKAVVNSSAELFGNEEIEALSGGENLIIKKDEAKVIKSYGLKKGTYPIEEEFEINFPVAEVLSHDTKILLSSVQCGIGSIIVDGEVILSLAVLQKLQNSDIIKTVKTFPFRLEIECEEATPNTSATAKAFEKSTKLDIVVDEDGGKSVVGASVSVELIGEAFEEVSVEVAFDAYSRDCEVELVRSVIKCEKPSNIKTFNEKINARGVVTPKIDTGLRLMSTACEKLNVIDCEKEDGGIKVSGTISAVGYAKDIDGVTYAVKFEAPFSTTLEGVLEDCSDFEIDGAVSDLYAKFVSLEEVELDAALRFTVKTKSACEIKVITGIKECGEKKINDSAISVYIPRKGEDLWTVSKRLNACPEEIMALNGDLQFPLSGDERIIIYRQEKKNY